MNPRDPSGFLWTEFGPNWAHYSARKKHQCGSAAGDKVWIARAPNLIGAVHLELYDLDVAAERNLEAYEIARKVQPWPEPCGHSLLKVGLAHLEKGQHGEGRGIPATGLEFVGGGHLVSLALAHPAAPCPRCVGAGGEARCFDDAWKFAAESLDMASHSDSRKHIARGRRLQGMVLAAKGRLEDAAGTLESAVSLAAQIGTQPDVWVAKCCLGQVCLSFVETERRRSSSRARLGRSKPLQTACTHQA